MITIGQTLMLPASEHARMELVVDLQPSLSIEIRICVMGVSMLTWL